ncbi:MAG: hypothetical protein SNJ78_07400 [Spirochaetales bacterium]
MHCFLRSVFIFLSVLVLGLYLPHPLISEPYSGIILQAVQKAAQSLPSDQGALQQEGFPYALLYDLDGDGMEDVFLLGVKKTGKAIITTDVKVLSDYSRVFESAAIQPFVLHVFLRRHSIPSLLRSIDLGERRALGVFRILEIKHSARLPFGIEVTFPSRTGVEKVWILVSSSSRFEVFTFQEQQNIKSYARDINGDGFLDLVVFENLFEDSVGYETYASWYRWTGTTYRRSKTVNLLRNLREFLRTIKQQILRKDWNAFFQFALQPQDAAFAKGAGIEVALSKIFRAPPPPVYFSRETETSGLSIELLEKKFQEIVFPEILENPFSLREDGPESFLLNFRLILPEESYVLSTRISLYKNFFGERMFHLVLQ